MTHSFDIIPDFELQYDRFERIEEPFLERLNPVLIHAFYTHKSSDLNEIGMCRAENGITTLSFVERKLSKRAILSDFPKSYVADGLAELVVTPHQITWFSKHFKVRVFCTRTA